MTNIIVALPKQEDARNLRNILVRSGFQVTGVCTSGAQAISLADGLHDGIIICGYKLADMLYSDLYKNLPDGFEMLLMASSGLLHECYVDNIVRLSMPLKVNDLVDTVNMMSDSILARRRQKKLKPAKRSPQEEEAIRAAKELLMNRNHMDEKAAHRYLQKCSMDSGTSLAETAQMVLSLMKGS